MPNKKYYVLVYEDNEEMPGIVEEARQLITSRLGEHKTKVECVVPSFITSQKEFDSWVEQSEESSKPTLAVVDLQIEEEDLEGVRAVQELRKKRPYEDFPIVVFSKTSTKNTREKAYDAGATSYVKKPTNKDRLVMAVAELLTYWIDLHEKRGSPNQA